MKKIIKTLLIIVVIIGLVSGGLYAGYRYRQGKKVAKVAPLSNIATTEQWFDAIQSFGEVTADKSQMGYIRQGAEVLSVNVKEGDHVEAGDVILTVKQEPKDINNKKLQITRANQDYKVAQLKLQRLLDTEPVPTYTYFQNVDADYTYKSSTVYKSSEGVSDFKGESYAAGEIIAEESFDLHGKSLGMSLQKHEYEADGSLRRDEKTGEPIYQAKSVDEATENEIKERFEAEDKYTTTQYRRSVTYFDYETGKVVAETSFNIDGEIVAEKKMKEGLNAQQLKDAIEDAQTKLLKQELELKKLQYELDTMENTNDNGEVLAKVSGTVSKLQDINNYNTTKPFFVVTATDEYFITGSLGEFYLNQVKVGDTVSISSWETGASAEAVITSISDTPSEGGGNFWGASGNRNSSNYDFKASFDKNSGIDIGTAVDISITPSEQSEDGLYIPSYLVRKDGKGSYVMRMNESHKLEKVYIKIGKIVWGDTYKVKSGITIDDYLAFPYGDGAIEGIQCQEVEFLGDDGGLG